MTGHFVQKPVPATPCPHCGGEQEGQCNTAAAVMVCGVFQVMRGYRPALHFVGFRGDEYTRAMRVWGQPDFVHVGWDRRAQREIAEGDTVVFATGEADQAPAERSFYDSNQRDDPAYWERLGRPMPHNP